MHLLYPSDPFDPQQPDETYRDEYTAALAEGLSASLFSFDDFEAGTFKARPAIPTGATVLYRGWMLTPENYARLVDCWQQRDLQAFTSVEQYRHCHHLPQWYPLLTEHTSETRVLEPDADFVDALGDLDWPGYFIKDYVKSLNTAGGSLVETPEQIQAVVDLMQQYRGQIEGGICVRKREDYREETEQRYFVFLGKAHAENGAVPSIVEDCARLIQSPFFSVDVVLRADGVLRIVELGDGQVSDRKIWPAMTFAKLLKAQP
ncbi:ATP-grasp domain-containing protein [Pseudomonas asplenii]|uniref:ATP-grasp domain-containing protein n=1 Tax=Pseudomonas asplenii TaxID=53407 RepID=UPI00035D6D5D|nr:ATP-grasp domain-containing protein [Pseudomonas fuscovaginae]